MRIDTKLIHGYEPEDPTGSVNVPIYQVSTYKQISVGQHTGYEYSRTGNPTRHALEEQIAVLEGGVRGFAFGSGMAALSTILMLFQAGDHIIVSDNVYGGTFRVIDKVFSQFNVVADFVDTSDLGVLAKAITPKTKAILVETPTNPVLKVTDLQKVAQLCQQEGLLLVVDNTFMSPYLQRPLELGAHIVFHSATKYLGGHSDVVAGLAVVNDQQLGERLHFLQNAVGAVLGPFDSWLLLRGMKTLGVRMDRHESNTALLAQWLRERPEVKRVYYNGFEDHPGHQVQKSQATGFGSTIAFELASSEMAEKLLNSVKLITLAESLGAVESLISLPAKMTHASIPPERRAQLGISDSLVRISVGIENIQDIISDLQNGLE